MLCTDHVRSTRACSGPESRLTPRSEVPYAPGGVEPERGIFRRGVQTFPAEWLWPSGAGSPSVPADEVDVLMVTPACAGRADKDPDLMDISGLTFVRGENP